MMKKINLVLACGLIGSAMILSGCTRTPKDARAKQMAANAAAANGDQSAQSYGVNGDGQFQGQNMAANASGDQAGNDMTVYFAFDSNNIDTKYTTALAEEANYLLSHPGARTRLAGNTDVRGSREYNIALGWRRAQAVAQFLEQHGVSAKQLALVSYGKERPAVTGNTDADYSLNRRTNLVFESHG